MENFDILKELGLTDGEVKVYFALFELGTTTVGPLSKKSGVTHAKVYPILEKLIAKGLASHTILRGRKHFSATNPDSLMELVDKKVRELGEERKKISDIIPSLKAKSQAFETAQYSRVFEGMKGLRSLFQELFGQNKENAEICVFGINDLIKQERFVSFLRFYHDQRHEHNVTLRLILNPTEINRNEVRDGRKQGWFGSGDEAKFVETVFPVGLFIFKDHVITIIADEDATAFDIRSWSNAQRYREFFDAMWSQAKK